MGNRNLETKYNTAKNIGIVQKIKTRIQEWKEDTNDACYLQKWERLKKEVRKTFISEAIALKKQERKDLDEIEEQLKELKSRHKDKQRDNHTTTKTEKTHRKQENKRSTHPSQN